MDIKSYMQQAYGYSYWANRRYLMVADGLTDEQLHRKQGHSWGDVHSVLVHVMSSESRWLSRWQGVSLKSHLDPNDFPAVAAVSDAWARIEADMLGFLQRQSADELLRSIRYTNFQGQEFTVPLWQMMMHVANHGTHHRGELASMFALMDVPHPEEEVIQYFLDLSGQKKA